MRSALALLLLGLVSMGEGTALASQTDPRLDALFAELLAAQDPGGAAGIEAKIWAIWLESEDPFVEGQLSLGVDAMNQQDFRKALTAFDALVAKRENFAEGWNRRATLFYLMGDFAASVADIRRTLELEPRHFGALSGLALIREAQRRPFEALEALEKVMSIHPQMPQLGERVDQLTAQLGEAI